MCSRLFCSGMLISLFISSLLLASPNYQETFLQANELYKSESFEKAYDLYKQIPKKSPQVHYNLGNCAFKMNKLGYAIMHWRRAEKDWGLSNRSELLGNIALAKQKLRKNSTSKLQDKKEGIIGTIRKIKKVAFSFVRSIPILTLQFIFLILWLMLFAYIRYFYKTQNKLIIYLLFLLAAGSGSILAIKFGLKLQKHGIIVADKTEMFSGPGTNYQSLGFLFEGQEGTLCKKSNCFYKIRLNGHIGWVNCKDIGKI